MAQLRHNSSVSLVRAGAIAVTEVPGASHSVMVSQPEEVVAVITQAIAHVAG